ncbi:tRNA-binding protein [Niabella sp. CJ426]|jgi:tRNA-binding protein|uniref:tRNA-binding protein n=1 Tax=Niabella sp. CJ426 TaxID=3393740 RepID=UPI003D04F414
MTIPAAINWSDFEKIDIRVGTVIRAEVFAEVRNPAYKLLIDFGEELGVKKSSAQITRLYQPEELLNKQVIAVVNFPVKQIANFFSECLVLGVLGADKEVTLLTTDKPVKNGQKIS